MVSTSAQRWSLLFAFFFGPWFVFLSACMREFHAYWLWEYRELLHGLSPKFSSSLLARITASYTGVLVYASHVLPFQFFSISSSSELKELIALHSSVGQYGGDLRSDTVTIIGATLDLQEKTAIHVRLGLTFPGLTRRKFPRR